ncbi:hypothetical protein HZP67_09960 [Elizabethkingia anophelis]|nr:hypothetical protein [Elizabethkingia anophelis]MCT4148166.1 hypothetical protein [Elizabethkingia anophelis]
MENKKLENVDLERWAKMAEWSELNYQATLKRSRVLFNAIFGVESHLSDEDTLTVIKLYFSYVRGNVDEQMFNRLLKAILPKVKLRVYHLNDLESVDCLFGIQQVDDNGNATELTGKDLIALNNV